jgi:caffeoyl-CoA O-methyltransferase
MDELHNYIASHCEQEPEHLAQLTRQANLQLLNPRMLSGHIQGRILSMLVRMIKPNRVLELGTYAGYSALCIAEAMPAGAVLDTIEFNDELEDFLASTFNQSAYSQIIHLHIGDCTQLLKSKLKHNIYDLVFIDANKRDYCRYYQTVLPMISPGGFIIADNVLWDGHVIDKELSKNDAQTKGILDFNAMVQADKQVVNVLMPIRDGLMLIQKK